jgi:adenine deaminase
MNFPGLVHGDEGLLRKVLAFEDQVVDGHAPLLSGKALNAYLTAGIGSDHECSQLEEAKEKLSRGMYIMIREGTAARNMQDLLPLVTPMNSRRMIFVTDDRHLEDLSERGHMNQLLSQAVRRVLTRCWRFRWPP